MIATIILLFAAEQRTGHGPLLAIAAVVGALVWGSAYLVQALAARRDRGDSDPNHGGARRAGVERAPEDGPWR